MKEPLALEPFFPDRLSGEQLFVQLTRRLRAAIETGALPLGTRLLGTRQLAKRLGLGRNTVALAFEQLTAEGYLATRTGSGTIVAAAGRASAAAGLSTNHAPPEPARRTAALRACFAISTGAGPLRPGMPDLAAFPRTAWERCARKALDAYDGDLGYGRAAGLPALRDAIASHVRQFRGVTALPRQIIVVEGAQAAWQLIASITARTGDRVVVEDPCYALARAAFEAAGLSLVPVPVDADGLCVDALPRDARLTYVTPTHQYPLGGTLPVARRTTLLQWAVERDAYIVEDDYDSEFTSKAQPLPPLQCLDREERVVYVGSFSKTLAPAIRVGYIVAPPHLVDALTIARAVAGLGVGIHLQATLADFIAQGHFARHIRRTNAAYDRRRAVLIDALQPALRAGFRLGPALTGLHVALLAEPGFDDVAVASSVEGQRLVPLSTLCINRRDCRGFLLGFTNGSDEAIEAAARNLVNALQAAAPVRYGVTSGFL
jgi:GntR family transcriptional regulator / MocR family aminotransferase